jgi:hypothetical protein
VGATVERAMWKK